MAIKTNEGKLIASGLKFGVVVARFNEFISSKLLGGVIDGLIRHGASEEDIEISWVPGLLRYLWWLRKWPIPKNLTP